MQYTNLIIVAFPAGAGGKFLINCLGLSDNCCLQHAGLLEKQLNKQFSPQDKINYLIDRLDKISLSYNKNGVWDDLGLGDWELFGEWKKWENFTNKSHLFNHDKLLFMIAHNKENLQYLIDKFPNNRRIYFDNYKKFFSWRFNNDSIYHTLPGAINHKIRDYVLDKPELISFWDADDYLIRDIFMAKLKNLYNLLGLTDFNQNFIEMYYNKYMLTLEKIKNDRNN